MKVGLEIECCVNMENFDKPKGGYHHGNPISDRWTAEDDGSLNTSGTAFEERDTYEFVSKVFSSKAELMSGLSEFKALFGDKELHECLEFNNSCGAHVHFSYDKNFGKIIPYTTWEKLRAVFLKKIEESSINKEAKTKIVKRYFRTYAEKVTETNNFVRNREINVTNEDKGMEWRALNLTGINKWDELFLFYDIVWDCLWDLQKDFVGKQVIKNKSIKVSLCAI